MRFLRKRAIGIFVSTLLLFGCIGVHLGFITHKSRQAVLLADAGHGSRSVTAATVRGTIYDRFMQPLVNREKVYKAALLPDSALLTSIRPYLDEKNFRIAADNLQNRQPAIISLPEPLPIIQGVTQFLAPQRYAIPQPAAHIIGYLDGSGLHGVTGIEKAYDEILSAFSGKAQVSYAVSGSGEYLKGAVPDLSNSLHQCQGGIALTLDSHVQQIVEETTAGTLKKGAVVVLDPCTGQIIASASFPAFHPLSVADSLQQENGALLNRAFGLYDCGSVFKIVTAAAALKSGISPQQKFVCNGGLTVGKTLFHCHNRKGHHSLNMYEAFSSSCNLYFIQLAQLVGAEAILQMADLLGLTEQITLCSSIQASPCVLPDTDELRTPAALANLSFGQGRLLLTPLHVARMTAIIANSGHYITPSLVMGTVTKDKQRKPLAQNTARREGESVLSPDHARILQSMMVKVVNEGTGKKAALNGVSAAGKTGTAQTGQFREDRPVVHSWFTGYFPAEKPKYVVTVLVEDAQPQDKNAAQLFCEISNNLIKNSDIKKAD